MAAEVGIPGHDVADGRRDIRGPVGHHLVGHRADRVDVRPLVEATVATALFGAMYDGVPTALVSPDASAAAWPARGRPAPPVGPATGLQLVDRGSSRFAGAMARWTTPSLCSAATARATSAPDHSASAGSKVRAEQDRPACHRRRSPSRSSAARPAVCQVEHPDHPIARDPAHQPRLGQESLTDVCAGGPVSASTFTATSTSRSRRPRARPSRSPAPICRLQPVPSDGSIRTIVA